MSYNPDDAQTLSTASVPRDSLNSSLPTHLKLLRANQIPPFSRPAKPTAREKRQYVAEKLRGFEQRQAAREQQRKEQQARERQARRSA